METELVALAKQMVAEPGWPDTVACGIYSQLSEAHTAQASKCLRMSEAHTAHTAQAAAMQAFADTIEVPAVDLGCNASNTAQATQTSNTPATTTTVSQICATCSTPQTPDHTLNRCKCHSVYYCNPECQRKEWQQHKEKHRHLCQEMKRNKTKGEEQDDCLVCLEKLPVDIVSLVRMSCCGKACHFKCALEFGEAPGVSWTQKMHCMHCRNPLLEVDSSEEFASLHKWARKGKAWAQMVLGNKWRVGSNDRAKSPAKAVPFFELAVEQGNSNAMFSLGCMYLRGEGVLQSKEKARALFTRGITFGHARCQAKMAELYRDGKHGVCQSFKKAVALYTLAAEDGNSLGMNSLGLMYFRGQGVEISLERTYKWWVRAAKQGNDTALGNLNQLAQRYRLGAGVAINYTKAYKIFKFVAKKGNATGQTALGGMYAKGQGVDQSFDLAYKWWTKSAVQGGENAIVYLKLLGEGAFDEPYIAYVSENVLDALQREKKKVHASDMDDQHVVYEQLLVALEHKVGQFQGYTDIGRVSTVAQHVQSWNDTIRDAREQARLLDASDSVFEENPFESYRSLWEMVTNCLRLYEEWTKGSFAGIDADNLENVVD